MTKSIKIFSAALLISLVIASCIAKESVIQQQMQPVQAAPVQQQQPHSRQSLITAKLVPQQLKPRSARSLSDMFERVKNRIFGKKQSASASAVSPVVASNQIQTAASAAAAQRQPWMTDLNALNSQFNPYTALSNGNFQWPMAANSQYFPSQQYQFPGASGSNSVQSPQAANGMISSLDAISQAGSSPAGVQSMGPVNGLQQQQQQPVSGSSSNSNGGLFSSASHLIAQYLSPGSGSPNSAAGQINSQSQQQSVAPSSQSLLTPQQQQQQSQYQEFASILDSMVAQTGTSNVQRQPQTVNQFNMQPTQSQQQPQQAIYPSSQQQQSGIPPSGGLGDNDMSSSSNVQSYMPTSASASPQQASQKSSMVSLAEQLAPGAQFNKLISFPFSLSPNDDATKEGRYKLHIPFLNQHVKRSDQQAAASQQRAAAAAASQQQQSQQIQQYMSSLYNQQQPSSLYSGSSYGPSAAVPIQQQSQLVGQASQVKPSIVSPSQATGVAPSISASSAVQSPTQSLSSSSASIAPTQTASQSSASLQSNPSVSSSVSSSSSSSISSSSSSSSVSS